MVYVAFPDRRDAIFANSAKTNDKINIDSSGSLGVWYDKKCHKTYPNATLGTDIKNDWCSNIGGSDKFKGQPWISYSIKDKLMKIKGYSLRNGCCWYECCCEEDGTIVSDAYCCCRLSQFALEGSNDNITWNEIHSVNEDKTFYLCHFKTYEFEKSYTYRFLRLVLKKPYPGCPNCMQINQIEFYGETIHSPYSNYFDGNSDELDDDSISIIGKIKKGDQNNY